VVIREPYDAGAAIKVYQNRRTGAWAVRAAISSNSLRVSASSGLIFGATISTRAI
jgi:hypothetical protein